jgi:hypothetical protein
MVHLVLTALAVTSIMVAAMTVLVRRERRRTGTSTEAQLFEAAATKSLRDARRQAHANHQFSMI